MFGLKHWLITNDKIHFSHAWLCFFAHTQILLPLHFQHFLTAPFLERCIKPRLCRPRLVYISWFQVCLIETYCKNWTKLSLLKIHGLRMPSNFPYQSLCLCRWSLWKPAQADVVHLKNKACFACTGKATTMENCLWEAPLPKLPDFE